MADRLKLKGRILGENFAPAILGCQELQFLPNISNFGNFDRLLLFVNKLPPQDTNLSTVLVSGETPS